LPQAGELKVTFSSSPRELALDVNDLSEFGLGVGKLETPPIPVGEFISVQPEIGSHNPITLTKPTLTLAPVIGTISTAEVQKAKTDDAAQAERGTTAGAIAAGVGGIVGGLGALPFGAPKAGAEYGGLAAGKAAEWLAGLFGGDREVRVRLDQGEIAGKIGLLYTPYLKLKVAATGFQWLANLEAELRTALKLEAAAAVALSGSEVVLHFHDGKLVRTLFTLTPAARLALTLSAEGVLKLGATLASVYDSGDGGPGRDPGLLHGEIETNPFHLFDITGEIGGQAELTVAKGSPMEVFRKGLKAASGGTRERFTSGISASGPRLPFAKRRGELDKRSRTGKSQDDAILMNWHKPADWYPDYLTRPGRHERSPERLKKFPHQVYDNGFAIGVNDWPYEGKKLVYRGGEEPRGSGVDRFMRELREEAIELGEQLAYTADIDHVIDWAFTGPDDETNLWPLNSSANRSAGTTQNRFQKVWWCQEKDQPPQLTAIEQVPTGRWFEIENIRSPEGIKGR
jgi:hypothetical protein